MVYIDDHIADFDLQSALLELSEQRREQALRFRFESGQRQCVAAYLLLKRALREEYGLKENPLFEYGEHGKPYLLNHPEIHFSLSHCSQAVACAVSNCPVGIDVESVREYKESLARYTMNEDELSAIFAAEHPGVAFTRLWTMKEARLKCSGEGLRNDMKSVLSGTSPFEFETVVDPLQRFVCTAFSPGVQHTENT